jgi:ABC-type lipoprotein export system ATPase subunit
MQVDLSGLEYEVAGRRLFSDFSHTFIGPGSIAVMGPSGSGKSTLLGLIAGILTPDTGQIDIDWGGVPAERAHPAWIFQSSSLLPHRNPVDNAMTAALMTGMPEREAQGRALDALKKVGLTHLALVKSARLSGGERQRVAVARAIVAESPLILADEPTASLDAGSRGKVVDALTEAASSGALVLVATHDLWVAERCERIFALTPNVSHG